MVRKISIFFAVLLFSVCAAAQYQAEHSITDFSKMMANHVNPFNLPDGAALEARNVRANQTIGALSKRPPMLLYGDAGSGSITGMHKYYKANDDKFTIVSTGTELKADYNGDRTFITLRDGLTDGARFTFATYKNNAIACNGVNSCQKYDGHTLTTADTDGARTAEYLTADLGAAFAELNTGTNLDAQKWYSYKVMFSTATADYYSDAISNPILTGASVHNITLTGIPLGPSGTTNRYIYRTEGQSLQADLASATYKLAGTISDNSTVTWNDAVADGSLTTTWSASGKTALTPPIGKFVLIHKEKVWIANNPSYKSDIYWSNTFRPDVFNPIDYEPIRQDDGDEITGLFNILGVIAIAKTNSWMKFVTLSADEDQWQVLGPYSNIGVQSPYASAYSPLGIIFLSKDGLYIFNGESAQLISDIVTSELRDALWTSRNRFAGAYYTNEYHLAYTSQSSGASVNNRVLVFDLERNAYVIDDKNISAFTVFDSGTDEGGLYSGSSLSDGEIFANNEETVNLIFKTKADLELWTSDDAVIYGTENDAFVEIGWTESLDDLVAVAFNDPAYANATLLRPDTDGTLTSPAIQTNAESYDKLYWNETLGNDGDITFQIRSAASAAAITGVNWDSIVTTPTGSDISGSTANVWTQIRANLSTTNILTSPRLERLNNYVIKLVYNREGNYAEDSVNGLWESGLMSFGEPRRMKRIWEIETYYEGDEGIVTVDLVGMDGDVVGTFDIDLSVNPNSSQSDGYVGNDLAKSYLYRFTLDGTVPVDYFFKYRVTDSGTSTWKVYRIATRFSFEDPI